MDKCQYCGESLDDNHFRVDFTSGSNGAIETWECKATGQRFKIELVGQAAEDAQREYKSQSSGFKKGDEQKKDAWWLKILKFLIEIIPYP